MYDLFKESNPTVKVGITSYKKMLAMFDIAFHKLKNDQCGQCTRYKNSDKAEEDVKNGMNTMTEKMPRDRRKKTTIKPKKETHNTRACANVWPTHS